MFRWPVAWVMEMIVNLARKNNETLIIVTHDGDIARYADRIIRLVDGAIVDDRKNESIVPRETETAPAADKTLGKEA